MAMQCYRRKKLHLNRLLFIFIPVGQTPPPPTHGPEKEQCFILIPLVSQTPIPRHQTAEQTSLPWLFLLDDDDDDDCFLHL